MEIRDWLAIIVIVFIVLILLDGFRRKWVERKTRIRVKLDKNIPPADGEEDSDILVKSELPNGGARIKSRSGQEVPVLMDSVDIDDEEIEEYPAQAAPGDDWEDAGPADDDWPDEEPEEDTEAGLVASRDDELWDDVDEEAIDEAVAPEDQSEDSPGEETDGEGDPWVDDDLDDDEDDLADVAAESEPSEPARRARTIGAEERIEPTFGDDDLTFGRDDQGELDLEHHDLFDHDDEEMADPDDEQDQAEEVLIINVMARPGAVIEGRRMLPVLMKHGMRLGDMSIFHRHADNSGKGPVMFSMANMLRPGTFSISEMETFTTPGVSFFMQLPNKLGNMQCFDQMLKTAQAVKEELDATLKDENRSVFTRQTIEHSRQRIRDFELEMLARK